jgi:prepilin-type N-terminal cleavage/methylation domain-containing protein
MLSLRKVGFSNQSGVSLMELLIAMAISLVVSLAMVSLMANTLGTGTRTIEMSRLTAELRTGLQIMTRELRRANFHANFTKCFGNVDCRATMDNGDADAEGYIKAITVDDSVGTDDCMYFWYDRDADGDSTDDDDVAAFRRTVISGVGVLQMTTTRNLAPSCSSGTYWTSLTDPNFVDVTDFTINNSFSYTDTITDGGDTQSVGKISMSLTGVLVRDANVSKTVIDLIRVRNDIFAPATGPIISP